MLVAGRCYVWVGNVCAADERGLKKMVTICARKRLSPLRFRRKISKTRREMLRKCIWAMMDGLRLALTNAIIVILAAERGGVDVDIGVDSRRKTSALL